MRIYLEAFLIGLFVGCMIHLAAKTANDINSIDYNKIILDGIRK